MSDIIPWIAVVLVIIVVGIIGGKEMSIYSDYKCGALTDEEFRSLTAEENRREKAALEELYYGPFDDEDEDQDEDEWDTEVEDIDE